MNVVSIQTKNYDLYNKSSKPAFKGDIGKKFVQELQNGGDVKPEEIVNAVKSTFGLNTEKVADVLDELRSRATILIHSDKNADGSIKYFEEQIAEKTARQAKLVAEEEQRTIKHIEDGFKSQESKIKEQEAQIEELNGFSAGYKSITPLTREEARILSPQETMETIKKMSESAKEAHEDMLNFLLTGKGGQKAVEYTNMGTELCKTYSDGVFRIPEVEEVNKKFHGHKLAGPEQTLVDLMKTALYVSPKGSYINAAPIKNQVKKNAVALLSTISSDSNGTEQTVDKMLSDVINIHSDLYKAKSNMKLKHPDREYKFEPNNYHDAKVTEYKDGKEINNWSYGEFSYNFRSN